MLQKRIEKSNNGYGLKKENTGKQVHIVITWWHGYNYNSLSLFIYGNYTLWTLNFYIHVQFIPFPLFDELMKLHIKSDAIMLLHATANSRFHVLK